MARGVQKDMTTGSAETPPTISAPLSLVDSIGAACSGRPTRSPTDARADQRKPNKRSAYPIPTPATIDPKNTPSRITLPRRVRQKRSRLRPPILSASLVIPPAHHFRPCRLRGAGRSLHACASKSANEYCTPPCSASWSKQEGHSFRHLLSTTIFHASSGSTR